MFDNYIFSGFGYSAGKFKISNSDIFDALRKGYFEGFSEEKIANSEKFKKYSETHPEDTPFDFFAGNIMGFYERHYVRPFPPRENRMQVETSLELAVKAVRNAMVEAEVQAKDIDAWFVSTVSPHQQAPGIAGSVKSFFTDAKTYSPAFTLTSGCAGFNQNLQKCIEYFMMHKEARYAVVAHTETMSSFLNKRTKFVPFVTFGDAAAAVVVERVRSEERFGVLEIRNFHDLRMLDFVGVDNEWNLYMDDTVIKDRACENIPNASRQCLESVGWTVDDIEYFVPHQTGNVIVKQAAAELGICEEKVCLQAQRLFGNVSGATVPLCLALLAEDGKLAEGTKIVSATAGVGGDYGAFAYKHKVLPPKRKNYSLHAKELDKANVLVLGASGNLGIEVCRELASRGANLWLQANSNAVRLVEFEKSNLLFCNFADGDAVDIFIDEINDSGVIFDYVINLAEVTEGDCMMVNAYSPVKILNSIVGKIGKCVLNVGSAVEDLNFDSEDCSWASSKRAFHGYLASASGEYAKYGIRSVYMQLGFINGGFTKHLPPKSVFKFMVKSRQED
ncbi:MAG: SDR family NAD(P)-dependent oxidoreductase, partial [Bacteroidales bacterium]|nr:SDR family NAD(P)-dependent oxidoreductase [Bacteroidales bacterium]